MRKLGILVLLGLLCEIHGYADILGDAVGAPGVWTTGGSNGNSYWWACDYPVVACGLATCGGSAWIKTTVTGPFLLKFKWLREIPSYYTLALKFYVDSVFVQELSQQDDKIYTPSTSWPQASLCIGYGTHELKWEVSKTFFAGYCQEVGGLDNVQYISIPELAWTGEANYSTDGLDPEGGDQRTIYTYRVKYTDQNSKAPIIGYPKVHIKSGGVEISGSPFTMTYVSGVYNAGAIYTYPKMLNSGATYTYYFEAYDINSTQATGTPTTSIDAPDITNTPSLAWTGELNYTADGLNPETGNSPLTAVFRVKYTDLDNDTPAAGYPKVHIKNSGAEIAGSPFAMTEVDAGDSVYSDGKFYAYSTALNSGAYSYYFEASDLRGSAASTGEPLTERDGPVVIGSAALPSTSQEMKVYHGLFKPGENEKSYITFNTPTVARVTIKAYDTIGNMIRELFNGTSNPGLNSVAWDGTNSNGQKVSSGVYTIRIEGPGLNQSKRVIVVR